jgi:hypothetical protein
MNIFFIFSCCVVQSVSTAPKLDGSVGVGEYGDSTAAIAKSGSAVSIRFARHSGFLYIAAVVPDSTYYWGDDLVISLDPDGSGGTSPRAGDRQWYLRRTTDSSVVITASGENGRWYSGEPEAIRTTREGPDWRVASSSSELRWIVELRIRESSLSGQSRIAFRTYDDKPQGWWSLPEPSRGTPAQHVERTPSTWLPLILR